MSTTNKQTKQRQDDSFLYLSAVIVLSAQMTERLLWSYEQKQQRANLLNPFQLRKIPQQHKAKFRELERATVAMRRALDNVLGLYDHFDLDSQDELLRDANAHARMLLYASDRAASSHKRANQIINYIKSLPENGVFDGEFIEKYFTVK